MNSPKLVDVPVEPFEFSEEIRAGEVLVEDADTVVRISRAKEIVPGFFNGFHMAGCYISRSSDEGEVFHGQNPYVFCKDK
jgi:hypothetical protein